MKTVKYILTLIILLHPVNLSAQDSIWTLNRCIEYALSNNLQIKNSEWDIKLSEIHLQTSQVSRYPTLNLSSNYSGSFGRSINPVTNQFENTQFTSTGISASSNLLIFGWFQKRHQIRKSGLQNLQAEETFRQIRDDVILSIYNIYLRALLSKEQTRNILNQIELSYNNKERIRILLENGRSNTLELSQAHTQLASDSSLYLQAVLDYEQSIIELKTILNLDLNTGIFISEEKYEDIFFIEKLSAETIFSRTLNNHYKVKQSEYKVKIAEKDLQISRAQSLPQISVYVSGGTNYSSSFYEILPSGERQLMNFGRQLNSNFSQSIGLGLSVPVFNNLNSRNSIRTSEINMLKSRISNEETLAILRQDIYKACNEYETALMKYQNALSIVQHSIHSFNAAQVRYDNGFITHFEYITEKNNHMHAQIEATVLKYELWFKKILVERYESGGLNVNY